MHGRSRKKFSSRRAYAGSVARGWHDRLRLLNRVGGLVIDPASEARLTSFYGEFTGVSTDYPAVARECKEFVARDIWAVLTDSQSCWWKCAKTTGAIEITLVTNYTRC